MSKLLLLVQSEADVAHLGSAATAILASSITGTWVVFSPAITVNASEAASKLDTEIAGLKKAERDAAERSDYEAAAGYKLQREGKELDRAKALRDAWKTAPAEDRQARTNAIFGPFVAPLKERGLNAKVTMHSDHYDREQWVAMLNSLSGVWFKEFTPGGFMVAWPESVAGAIKQLPPPAIPKVPAVEKAVTAAAPQTRAEELQGLRHFGLVAVAKKLQVGITGKDKPAIIAAILAAEQAPAAPALAEY